MADDRDELERVLEAVAHEVRRAQGLFSPIRNEHEGYAVLLEEVDEFWDEVKRKNPDYAAMYKELVQVAAMAVRTTVDVVAQKRERQRDDRMAQSPFGWPVANGGNPR